VLAAAAAAYAAHRIRVGRLLAVERVRLQVASDLHDEMGSGLGAIGILAGVLSEGAPGAAQTRELGRKIAATAGELGVVVTDIVWSLRPGAPSLEELACRLAEHGRRLFPESQPEFRTTFPETWPASSLALRVRRNLLLIVLEAFHNAARHSGAQQVSLSVAPEGARWSIRVSDDGCGLAAGTRTGSRGLGLESMRRRASEIGAEIAWSEGPHGGTTVSLVFDPEAGARDGVRRLA
jgi:signal transduction histidine kinase